MGHEWRFAELNALDYPTGMPMLLTSRLVLLPLNRAMLQNRVKKDEFKLLCDLPGGPQLVHFPAQWPGDPLASFPSMLEHLGPQQQEVDSDGSFAVITQVNPEAIGALGRFGPLSETGEIEIGYGMNPDHWGQGYATEAAGALVAHLLTCPGIRTIKAHTAVANRASERVLEKLGFMQVGTNWSEEDGALKVWEYSGPKRATLGV